MHYCVHSKEFIALGVLTSTMAQFLNKLAFVDVRAQSYLWPVYTMKHH